MWQRIFALATVVTMTSACGLLPGTAAPTPPPPQATVTVTAPAPPTASASASPTASASASGDTRPALASTLSSLTPTLKVDVIGLNRIAGKHLVIQLRLNNTGESEKLSWTGQLADNTRPIGAIRWASGIGVLDTRTRRWIMPYQPEDSPCLCTDEKRDGVGYFIEPGESITVQAVVPAPVGNPESATVITPVGPPMLDVPISDEPPTPLEGQDLPDPDGEPVKVISYPVKLPSESLDKSEETDDDGKDLRVNLSSDVLFAVGKATLTAKAKGVLARTAELIDGSRDPSVQVEGHADSSGTDAINNPLSQRRAQAVQRALSELLTRKGVRFNAKGYGSRRPLYDNDEEEGKRRNRRVSVTFAKPSPVVVLRPSAPPADTGAPGLTATTRAEGVPFELEVTGIRRLPGDIGLLTYKITNRGDEEAWYHELGHGNDWMSYSSNAATNVTLTDSAARRLYRSGRITVVGETKTEGYCACSELAGVRSSAPNFNPGETKEFYNLFALPATTSSLTAKIATFKELEVPVS